MKMKKFISCENFRIEVKQTFNKKGDRDFPNSCILIQSILNKSMVSEIKFVRNFWLHDHNYARVPPIRVEEVKPKPEVVEEEDPFEDYESEEENEEEEEDLDWNPEFETPDSTSEDSSSDEDEDQKEECKVCHKLYNSKLLPSHMRKYHNDDLPLEQKTPFCTICNKFLASFQLLKRHNANIHCDNNAKAYQCPICYQGFPNKHQIEVHMERHSQEKKYQCYICGKAFNTNNNCINHVKNHDRSTWNKICEICGARFRDVGNLKAHIKTHTRRAPYKCDKCSKEFKTKVGLQEHYVSTHDETKNKCEYCGKVFASMLKLKRHNKIHTTKCKL